MNKNSIKLADDSISERQLSDLVEWLRSGERLTKGEQTERFEKAVAELYDVPYAIFVNSGSSANLLMLYAMKIAGRIPSGKIIVPAISWVTTLSPAIQFGLDITLCDCNMDDLGLDLNHFEYLCKTVQPDVAFIAHILGHVGDMQEILKICEQYNVTLIEDACEAFGTVSENQQAGTFGEMASFSFYYGHQATTIEGGMLLAKDSTLANIARSLRAHGWSRDLQHEFKQELEEKYNVDEFKAMYTFYYPGFNFRPTDLQAFIGLQQMQTLDSCVLQRQANYERYHLSLGPNFWVQKSNYQRLSALGYATFCHSPNELFKVLKERGIESRPLLCGNLGRQPFWLNHYNEVALKNADFVSDHGIYFPLHQNMLIDDIDRVVELVKEYSEPVMPEILSG
ncbi:MAG: CDP-6-deoxy-D-xylo-4-hexulose-3-dehydrase [Saprospiraceae bacterium]|jgi:CDP-6-deoxy-D-xylo-4-hexulose-3-dehydrase